jgi:DNA-binding NtrC family response regulator
MNEIQMSYSEPTGGTILIVDDVPANLSVLQTTLETAGYNVSVAPSGEIALRIVDGVKPDLILLDILMPGMDGFEVCRELKTREGIGSVPILFLSAQDDKQTVIRGFQHGGVDYLIKPYSVEEVLARVKTHLALYHMIQLMDEKNDELEAQNKALKKAIEERDQAEKEREKLTDRLIVIEQQEDEHWDVDGIITQSSALQHILSDLTPLSQARSVSVLIMGESGTGKELVARAIHRRGANHTAPFIPVNCSAIPRELAESLLFGHRAGAFTGATHLHKGYFETAEGGTLFLDEISSMPLELQSKLLRVLETQHIQRLGDQAEREVNVRVVAASNQDLQTRIAEGSFRQDLYYRLARFTLTLPTLRERPEDVPILATHFIRMFAIEMNVKPPEISQDTLNMLKAYTFPGNVRELKNLMERAVLVCGGQDVLPVHIPFDSGRLSSEQRPGPSSAQNTITQEIPFDLAEAEVYLIQRALKKTDGNVAAAARLLGVGRQKIYHVLARQS